MREAGRFPPTCAESGASVSSADARTAPTHPHPHTHTRARVSGRVVAATRTHHTAGAIPGMRKSRPDRAPDSVYISTRVMTEGGGACAMACTLPMPNNSGPVSARYTRLSWCTDSVIVSALRPMPRPRTVGPVRMRGSCVAPTSMSWPQERSALPRAALGGGCTAAMMLTSELRNAVWTLCTLEGLPELSTRPPAA